MLHTKMPPKRIKQNNSWIWIVAIHLLFICISIALFYLSKNYCDSECRMLEFQKGRMSATQTTQAPQVSQSLQQTPAQQSPPNTTYERDLRVLVDPLYPPLNRTEIPQHNALKQIATRAIDDEYRLIGYYTAESEKKDAGNNSWKLFARKLDSNRSNFYMSPTDKNLDIKVPITDEIIASGYRLRDIYTLTGE